jgi:hypothetical protein
LPCLSFRSIEAEEKPRSFSSRRRRRFFSNRQWSTLWRGYAKISVKSGLKGRFAGIWHETGARFSRKKLFETKTKKEGKVWD